MKIRAIALVLALAGCGAPEAQRRDEPQSWSGSREPSESPSPWHRDLKTGLAVRLVADAPHVLGRPITVRVEAKNLGTRTVCFDTQGLLFHPFSLVGPDGRDVLSVDACRGQSWQHIESLEPEASLELTRVDVTDLFLLLEAGTYAVQFIGLEKWDMGKGVVPSEARPGSLLSGVPESAPLRLDVLGGALRPQDEILRRIHPILPKGWRVYRGKGASIVLYRSDLDRFDRGATFTVECGAAAEPAERSVGASPWGEIYIGPVHVSRMDARDAEDQRLEKLLMETVLPGLREDIRRVLARP